MTDENDRWSMRGAGTPLGDRTITVREDKAPTKSAGGGKKFNSTVLGDSPAGGDGCRCFFGNLAWETTEETLTSHAATFGMTVVQCEVARQSGGRSKGWALVDFATPEEAQNAIEQMHNSEIQGRSIIVRVERPGAGQKSARVETRPENSSGLQIVVRNLPWTTTSEDLRQRRRRVPRRYGPLQGLGYRALRDPRASASGDPRFQRRRVGAPTDANQDRSLRLSDRFTFS